MRRQVLVLAASVGLAATALASGPAEPFLVPVLSGRSAPAKDVVLISGAGRYAFSSGTAWEVVDGARRPLGLWVQGDGVLEWTTDDPAAMKVYRGNAGRVGGLDTPKDGPIVAKLTSALVLHSAAARPSALPELQPGEAPAAATSGLTSFLRRWKDDVLAPPAAGLAAASADGRKYWIALVAAEKDVRHEVDETRCDLDTLTVVERPAGLPTSADAYRVGRTVGSHPIGRSRRASPRVDWILTDLSVDVRETEGFRGVLAVEETILPQRPLTALSFDLDGLSLSPRLLSRRETVFQEASLADGTPLSVHYAGGVLVVFLPKAAPAGVPLTLRFRYDAPYFERYGDNYWELPLAGAWYPQPPAVMVQARHGLKAVVRAKKPLVPIAPGRTVRRFEDGEWNGVESVLEPKSPFQAILAGKYTFHEETKGGVTARVASYGVSKPKSAAKLLSLFHAIREFYEPYLGPFPFPEYTIVEVNDYGFGQAPPGLMRITHEAFEANQVGGDFWSQVFSGGVNERIAHELAHAYWGGVVWNAQDADVWLVEAFAEVAAGRAIEVLRNPREYERLRGNWKANAKESASRAPMPYAWELVAKASPGAADTLVLDSIRLTYSKGPALLAAIRGEIGDDLFFTAMKSFQKSFATRRPAVVTSDFVGLLEYMTKKDWKPWFERYYYGTEVP